MRLSDASIDEIFTELQRRNQIVLPVRPDEVKRALERDPLIPATDENIEIVLNSGHFIVRLTEALMRALPDVVEFCTMNFEGIIDDRIDGLESICFARRNVETGEDEFLPGFTQEQRQAAHDQIEPLMDKLQTFINAVDGIECDDANDGSMHPTD